ncbi:transposase [Streptomyces sp. NPDC005533]|uniref:transposase n=1 Tax=Streptomyces sp. NPDC005533 TaxID=3364723 RepID=UPI0036B9509B
MCLDRGLRDRHRHSGDHPAKPATAPALRFEGSSRLRSEASFASLCGVSPVEVSSGRTQRRTTVAPADRQTPRSTPSSWPDCGGRPFAADAISHNAPPKENPTRSHPRPETLRRPTALPDHHPSHTMRLHQALAG